MFNKHIWEVSGSEFIAKSLTAMFVKNTGIEITDFFKKLWPLIPVLGDFMFVSLQLDKFIAVCLIALLNEAV